MPQNLLYDLKNNCGGGISLTPSTNLSGSAASNGTWVDCGSLEGPVHGLFGVGSALGSPDSYAVACKLQEASDTSGTGAQDLASQSSLSLTADASRGFVRGIRTMRYVRCVMTPAFTGGTTPTVRGSAHVLGQKHSF